MSEKILKGYPAIAGASSEFPEIFGWNGIVTESMVVGWWGFFPSCDSEGIYHQGVYLLKDNEVYIPEIDGNIFPIEKNYVKKKD